MMDTNDTDTARPPRHRRRPGIRTAIGLAAAAALLFLTACEEQNTHQTAGIPCPGPDAISSDGRHILISPAEPGPVRIVGRDGVTPASRVVGAEGYGTAVAGDGSVAGFFSRRSDDGVIWRRSTGGTTVLPKPAGATVSIPTSISDDGRYVGITSAEVKGGPMTGHVYDVHTGTLHAVPGTGSISQLLLSGSGEIVYTAGTDGVIRRTAWASARTITVATVSPSNPSPIRSTTRAGRYLVYDTEADGTDTVLRIWDVNTRRATAAPAPLGGRIAVDQVEISNDGTRLVATLFTGTGNSRRIVAVNRTGGGVEELASATDGGRAVISANGRAIAYCRPSGAGGTARNVFTWLR